MNLKLLSTKQLDGRIKSLAQAERELLHDVVLTIKEIDSRKMYFEFGFPSLFEYLVEEVKYVGGSAQRRIDAARLMKDVPEVGEKIRTGEITLGQITLVQKAVRKVSRKKSVKVSAQQKSELINNITNMTEAQSEQHVCAFLDLPVVRSSKKTKQADGSTRHEFTLTPEVEAKLQQAQALLSHAVPTQDVAEFLEYVCDKIIKQKTSVRASSKETSPTNDSSVESNKTDSKESTLNESSKVDKTSTATVAVKSVNMPTKKTVLKNQHCCQYRHPETGKICGSTWFAQVDHRQSRWAGGNNELGNLQVLCAAHNQEKYRKEMNIRSK
jgi:HNH endonuclease.